MRKNVGKTSTLLIGACAGLGIMLCIYCFIRLMRDDIHTFGWRTDLAPLKKRLPFDFEAVSSRWAVKQITMGGLLPGPSAMQIWGILNISGRSADELREKYVWKPYEANGQLPEAPGFSINNSWTVSDEIMNKCRLKSYGGVVLLHGNVIYFFLQYN